MHMSRLGVVFAVACGIVAIGCSSEAPESSAPLDDDPGAAAGAGDADGSEPATDGDQFAVTFTGQDIPMNARAEMLVNEGERDVQLSITGRTSGTDVIVIELTFNGLENTFGTHSLEFSLPEGGPHDANGSLGGEWYYSQSGQAEVTISPDYHVEGHVDVVLAHAAEAEPFQDYEFKPSTENAPLTMTFSVPWVLSCHSRLAGHGILQPGGDYCDDLEF